ncbi:MAG: glycosyltransferase [Treponema sp.]|nr:glycosyltransferase [Treponema sp.]MBR1714936.1 glycosyltransferase [Treponema sp.]
MPQTPYISVIAAVYNTEPFLMRFMESLISQSFKDFELILVNDASVDGSKEICEVYEREYPFIHLHSHEKNMGLAAARQTGLDHATGRYVIFMDSDDFSAPDALKTMSERTKKTDCDILCTDVFYDYKDYAKHTSCKYGSNNESIIRAVLNNTIGCCGQYTRLVKRSLLTENGIRFTPGIDMFEDRVFAVKLFYYAKRIEYISKPLYHYVQYNFSSITKKLNEKTLADMKKAEEEIEAFLCSKTDTFKKDLLDFKCYIKFLIWLDAEQRLKNYSKTIFPEATRHVLATKSIPKFHTKLIFYLYCKNLSFFSNLLKFAVLKLKKMKFFMKEEDTDLTEKKQTAIFSKQKKFDVSVIIVNYNTRELLRNCLDSLYSQTRGISFETFVSDNGSKDGSTEMVAREFPEVKIIENNANLGFGAANNRALKVASGKYIFYLNSDTVVLNNAVKIFFDYWENERTGDKLGAIGGNLLDENNRIIHSAGYFRSINAEIKDAFLDLLRSYKLIIPFLKSMKLGKEPPAQEKRLGPVDYITGADLFVKNDEYAEFDERYFLYYEETDMQKRMELDGKARVLIDGPLIQHLKGSSNSAKNPLNFYKSVSKINTFLSCCKFQKKFNKNPVRLLLLKLIITLHWLNPGLVGKTGGHIEELWRI